VLERFLGGHPEFAADDLQAAYPQWRHPRADRFLQLLPDRDGTDGFFISRLRRR
jgi:16S rRNA (cytosine967-C5)-methyltransferase